MLSAAVEHWVVPGSRVLAGCSSPAPRSRLPCALLPAALRRHLAFNNPLEEPADIE